MAHAPNREGSKRAQASPTPSSPDTSDVPGALGEAVAAAHGWRGSSPQRRRQLLRDFRGLLVRRSRHLAELSPRPRAEFISSELIPLADACRWLESNAARILKTRRVGRRGRPGWLRGVRSEVTREPFGAVLIVAPSNYPVLLPGVSLLQAIAAGNSVVVKPGAGGAWAASALAELLQQAGAPAGLVGVLDDSTATAKAALGAGFDKVLFTGSAATGRKVLAATAATITPATVELSGCDASLLLPGADFDLAAKAIAFGLSLNGGCTCIAPRRLLVPADRERSFLKALGAALADRPAAMLDDATTAKLERLTAGQRPSLGGAREDGSFAPAVFTGLAPDHPIASADIFAPVCTVLPYGQPDEAVAIANSCPYKLGASVFGAPGEARDAARRLDVGNVAINDLIVPTADPRLPFPAVAESGFGEMRGPEGLLALTRPKAVAERRGRWRPHLDPPGEGDAELLSGYLQLAHGATLRERLDAIRHLRQALKLRRSTNP